VFEAMVRTLKPPKPPRYENRGPVLMALACYPDQAKALPVLREIASDARTFPAALREMAALQLRLSGEESIAPVGKDLQLVFGGDHEAAVEEFRKGLGSDDAATRRAAFELLKMAPDEVILALRRDLEGLRGEAAGALILGATTRTEAIERYRVK
jgi:HEAT repeat protein